jgi:hypothetical protein
MRLIWGIISVGIQIQVFLTSALDGSEWLATRPGRLPSEKEALATNWIGGWVGPRAGLDAVEKRKFLTLPELRLDPSLIQLGAISSAPTKLCLSIIEYHETPLL